MGNIYVRARAIIQSQLNNILWKLIELYPSPFVETSLVSDHWSIQFFSSWPSLSADAMVIVIIRFCIPRTNFKNVKTETAS